MVKGVITATDVIRYCLWAWTLRHVRTTTDVAVVGADAKRFGYEVGTRGYAGTFAGQLQEAFRERVRRGIVRTSSLYTHGRRLREQLAGNGGGSGEVAGGSSGSGADAVHEGAGHDDGGRVDEDQQVLEVSRHGGSAVEMRLVQAMEREAAAAGGNKMDGSGSSSSGRKGPGAGIMSKLHRAAANTHSGGDGDREKGHAG